MRVQEFEEFTKLQSHSVGKRAFFNSLNSLNSFNFLNFFDSFNFLDFLDSLNFSNGHTVMTLLASHCAAMMSPMPPTMPTRTLSRRP